MRTINAICSILILVSVLIGPEAGGASVPSQANGRVSHQKATSGDPDVIAETADRRRSRGSGSWTRYLRLYAWVPGNGCSL